MTQDHGSHDSAPEPADADDLVQDGSQATRNGSHSETREERAARDPRLGRDPREKGDGGLSWSVRDQRWIGSIELPPDPATGKRRRRRVADKTRAGALAKLQQARTEIAKGVAKSTDRRTVEGWLLYWLDHIKKPNLAQQSVGNYRNSIKTWIIPNIGHVKLTKLTMQHVRDMNKANLAKANKKGRSAQLAHSILNAALNDAKREGLITENVASLVKRPKSNPKSRGALTKDQAMQLLQSCIDREDPMTTRFAAALMIGARQGELIGLQWDRVDLERGLIDLSWQLQTLRKVHGCGDADKAGDYPCGRQRPAWCPKGEFDLDSDYEYHQLHRSLCLTRPKTYTSRRMVPMPPSLWETLKAHKVMTQDRPNPHGMVWTDHNGNPINPRRDWGAWSAALKAAGLEHVALHAARHTTASLLLEAGVDIHIIQQILGHSVVLTTKGYAHVEQELARQSMLTLGGLLGTKEIA
ncbi:tyrosine-type recombinase/integrase [Rhodococcus hoagii]|uniref:Tyrosine-type recombinase/integrase n=1 Tax=Rhodococcus hoagii TaxID=43767 RepID=A0A9Q4ZIL6_RHOHA|nr:tyrosine-type recombinase/integrase [Prescottella equi]NKT77215.1 tyrosine-type recombinase/integrase [Prescottella equi]NKZ80999.1 tyrosine-type recombinase/integrase [Prescottella equi]